MTDAIFSLLTTLLCYVAVVFLIDQQMIKPKPYKLAWAFGLFVYGTGALAQFFGTAGHRTPFDYRLWFLTGAILSAPYLGLGSIYLLMARKWADRIAIVLGIFTLYAIPRVLTVPLTQHPAWLPAGATITSWLASAPNDAVVNAGQHPIMPNDIVLVIILLNSLGAFALVGGAAWSAWKFYRTRQNPTRLASMILLMTGGMASTTAGTLAKLGVSGAFFMLTFIGALFLLAGYLVSIDVFAVFRVPFTNKVLLDRRLAAEPALAGTAGLVTGQQAAQVMTAVPHSRPNAGTPARPSPSRVAKAATIQTPSRSRPTRV